MQVTIRHGTFTWDHGPLPKGRVVDVPPELGEHWVTMGVADRTPATPAPSQPSAVPVVPPLPDEPAPSRRKK